MVVIVNITGGGGGRYRVMGKICPELQGGTGFLNTR